MSSTIVFSNTRNPLKPSTAYHICHAATGQRTCELMLLLFTFSHSGIKGADEDELREMASTPHSKHVYNVPNFDMIQDVQKKIITEVCSGVDEQLSFLVSGEECKSEDLKQMSYILLGYRV